MTLQQNIKPTPHRRRASLVDIAYESILEAIVDQQLPPGTRVNMDALRAELDMSNTPIREALARLTGTGLVQQISNRGFIVSPILNEDEYHHLFAVRTLLETNALRAATFDSETLATLGDMAQSIAEMEYGTTYRGFIHNLQTDESFHLGLVKASGNSFMVGAWQSLNFYSHVSRLHTHDEAVNSDQTRSSLAEHITIVDLLRKNDRDAAIDCLREHIRKVEARLVISARKLWDK